MTASGRKPLAMLASGEQVVWSARPRPFHSATPGQYATFAAGISLFLFGIWRLGTLYGLIAGDDAAIFASNFRSGSKLYFFGWLALVSGAVMLSQLPLFLWSMSGTVYHITDRSRVLTEGRALFHASQEAMDLHGPRRIAVVKRAFDWLVAVEPLDGGNGGLGFLGLTEAECHEALPLLRDGESDA